MTTRRIVVDHVLFVVGDLAASRRLYTAALAPVGYEELHVQENGVHYGVEGLDDFAIYQGAPVTTAAHVAFVTEDRASVDAFFEAALANGATPRGEPGVWTQYSERYYAAFRQRPPRQQRRGGMACARAGEGCADPRWRSVGGPGLASTPRARGWIHTWIVTRADPRPSAGPGEIPHLACSGR
jgi:catechol 2,3-dioxygenase-like lactoylglutathione lyase family enzyme